MDFNETMLKERFETAVGGISPDVNGLVDGGCELGVGMRRRRRAQGLGAAVASAAAVAAIAYVGIGQGLFGSDATGPADSGPTSVSQLVPSTPPGMAAAVMEHIGSGTLVRVAGDSRNSDTQKQISVDLGYRIDGRDVELHTFASDDVTQWSEAESCPRDPTVLWCDDTALADGTPAIQVLMKSQSNQDQPTSSTTLDTGPSLATYSAVSGVLRDGQLLAVYEIVRLDAETSYTAADLPISMETLRGIAIDPAVGLRTTHEFIEQGEQIPDFGDSGEFPVSSSGSATATPMEEQGSGESRTGPGSETEPAPQQPGESDSSSGP